MSLIVYAVVSSEGPAVCFWLLHHQPATQNLPCMSEKMCVLYLLWPTYSLHSWSSECHHLTFILIVFEKTVHCGYTELLIFLFFSLFSQLYSEAQIKTKHGTKHQRWCQTCSWFVLVWTRAWAGKHVAFSPLFTFSSYTKRKFSKVNQNAPPDKFQIIWTKQRRS